jgi:3-dehydroquinate synthase
MIPSYKPTIFSGKGCLGDFKQFISNSKYSETVVIVDENTQKYCLPLLNDYIGNHFTICISSGEENKTINTCFEVWNQLANKNIDRKALIINIGGGVICDMGGFIAATYKRGIDFVHIPTTLLSMCDASIGGKTGVNLSNYKNTIGVFKNPKAIIIHIDFLKTLSERQYLSGFAEIIKHSLINDSRFFSELLKKTDIIEESDYLVSHSIKIKTKIANLDMLEKGVRKGLNFGHTLGHALETYFLINSPKSSILHGEAVAAGMIAESWISYKKGYLNDRELKIISSFIFKYFSKLKFSKSNFADIIGYTFKDKKNEYQKTSFTLLDGIGHFRVNEEINKEDIKLALEYYLSI